MLQREDFYASAGRLCQARSQPSGNGRGSRFTQILDLFQGLKMGVPVAVYRGNIDF